MIVEPSCNVFNVQQSSEYFAVILLLVLMKKFVYIVWKTQCCNSFGISVEISTCPNDSLFKQIKCFFWYNILLPIAINWINI